MTTWILLRGLTREAAHWGDFPQILATALPGATVVALDLPGNGARFRERSPARIEAMADSCRLQCQARGLVGPFHALGLSMGGMVAASWASRYPAEIAACVLVNTSMRPFGPSRERLRPGAAAALLWAGLAPRRRESAVLAWTSARPAEHATTLDGWERIRRERPVSPANGLRQLFAAARFHAPAAPRCPTLIVASRHDRLVSPRCSIALAQAWHAPIALHPTAGHDLPLDDAPWVAAHVRAWLASL